MVARQREGTEGGNGAGWCKMGVQEKGNRVGVKRGKEAGIG